LTGAGGGGGGLAAARGAALPLVAERISASAASCSALDAASASFWPALATTAGLRCVRAGCCSVRTAGCSISAALLPVNSKQHTSRIADIYSIGEII